MSASDSFKLIREERINEINTLVRLYQHIQTAPKCYP
jgi:hypothetical protein